MDHLETEARNPDSTNLDELTSLEIVRLMNAEDAKVAAAVGAQAEAIARAIDAIAERLAAVTAEDVARCVRAYLRADHRTVVIAEPESPGEEDCEDGEEDHGDADDGEDHGDERGDERGDDAP